MQGEGGGHVLAGKAAQALVDEAMEKKTVDNVTAVVMLLHWD
jgi:serine/threonine protein phosphatase PrpC